jgi:bacterioferritin-associated ferredoxin
MVVTRRCGEDVLTEWNRGCMMRMLRLSLKLRNRDDSNVIICICRGKNEKDIQRAIDGGATTVRDLQRCGIGDQCGSCHNSLRAMLAEAAAAQAEAAPCPACAGAAAEPVMAMA